MKELTANEITIVSGGTSNQEYGEGAEIVLGTLAGAGAGFTLCGPVCAAGGALGGAILTWLGQD